MIVPEGYLPNCALDRLVCDICAARIEGRAPPAPADAASQRLASQVLCPSQVDRLPAFPDGAIFDPPDLSGVYVQYEPGDFAWKEAAQVQVSLRLTDSGPSGCGGTVRQEYEGTVYVSNFIIVTEPVRGVLPFRVRTVMTQDYRAEVNGGVDWGCVGPSDQVASGLIQGAMTAVGSCEPSSIGAVYNVIVRPRVMRDGEILIDMDNTVIETPDQPECPGTCNELLDPTCDQFVETKLPEPIYGSPIPPNLADVTGTVRGQLLSEVVLDTVSGIDVEQATVNLIRQQGFVRTEKLPGETDEDYQAYLAQQDRRPPIRSAKLTEADAGNFAFTLVRLIEREQTPGGPISIPQYYSIHVTNAETDELVTANMMQTVETTHYQNAIVRNLRATFSDGTMPIIDETILLSPGRPTDAKMFLAEFLSQPPTEDNYAPIEAPVISYLNMLNADPNLQTPEVLEGLQRVTWAERISRDSAIFADQLLGLALTGLGAFMADAYDELVGYLTKGRSVTEREIKRVDAQSANLDASAWRLDPDFSQVRAKMGNHLDGLRTRAADADFIDEVLIYGLKALLTEVELALIASEVVDSATAGTVKGALEKALVVVLKSVKSGALNGFSKASLAQGGLLKAAKFLIPEIVAASKPLLMDGTPSYAFLTAPILGFAADQFLQPWPTDDRAQFVLDRNQVINAMRRQSNEASAVIQSTQLLLGLGEGADAVEAGAGLIGTIPAVKWVKVIEKLAKAVKFFANGTAAVQPFETAFTSIPAHMADGVYRAFGQTPPIQLPDPGNKAFGRGIGKGSPPVVVSTTEVQSVLDDLHGFLSADDIGGALDLSGVDATDNYPNALNRLNRSVAIFTTQISSASIRTTDLVNAQAAYRLAEADLGDRLTDLYLNITTVVYAGPTDPGYQAERDRVLTAIAEFGDRLIRLDAVIAEINQQAMGVPLLPAVLIDDFSLASLSDGDTLVSESPEAFLLSAQIRNLGASAVNNVSAELSINSPFATVTAMPMVDSPIDVGTLEADDAAPDSGSDETTLQWTLTYAGDLRQELIFVSVDVLENDVLPLNFVTLGGSALLETDPVIGDQDLDLIPDNLELMHGLDITRDDAEEDADGDTIVNFVEIMQLGTNPQLRDSDGDGVDDDEEITGGSDGFVTDPLVADTDGDGVNDAADGDPRNAGSAAAPASRIGEPIVVTDRTIIRLTEDNPVGFINVSNGGTGTLTWTAVSQNDNVAAASPTDPTLRNGPGVAQIAAPKNFDFTAGERLQTTVHIVDLGGDTHDSVMVEVEVGTPDAQVFGNGFEVP